MLAFIDKHMASTIPQTQARRAPFAGWNAGHHIRCDSTKRYEFLKGVAGEASTKKIDGRIVQVLLYDYLGVHGWNDIQAMMHCSQSNKLPTVHWLQEAAISTYRIENCLLDEAQADPLRLCFNKHWTYLKGRGNIEW